MFVETFYEHCDFGLYTLKYPLLDQVVEYIIIFEALSVLDSRAYEQFNVHMKQAFRTTSRGRRTQIKETVHMMEKTYAMAVPS